MKNLIIDIEKHFPVAYKLYGPCDYFSPVIPLNILKPLQPIPTAEKIEKIYDIKIVTNHNELEKEYEYIFIVFPINSFNDPEYTDLNDIEERRIIFKQLYGKVINNIKFKKIIYLDDNDRGVISSGLKWMDSQNLKVDYVFKREYKKSFKSDYDDRVFPAPWLIFGDPNPIWLLFEKRKLGSEQINECFWAGRAASTTAPDDVIFDRTSILNIIQNNITVKNNLSRTDFLNNFNTYKFFLHLNGNGHICKRLYEGLSGDSLMLMEEMDIVFPFDDFFAEECLFKTGEEFLIKFEKLKNDQNLYNKCKDKQEEIIKKYLNYDWIKNYTFSKII
jgi:hypothetical protein